MNELILSVLNNDLFAGAVAGIILLVALKQMQDLKKYGERYKRECQRSEELTSKLVKLQKEVK